MIARIRIAGYREFVPPAGIADCCEALWTHQAAQGPRVPGAAHRVLPEMAVSLAFQGFRDEDGVPVSWAPMIIGPKLRAQIYDLVPGRELTAIRIKAEWVGPLLGVDPLDLEDQVSELADVCPALAARLSDALRTTRSAEAALHVLLGEVVRARATVRTPPSPIASAALDLVRGSAGRVSCERVASSIGLSDRHLRRHVHDSTGVSPKTYARVIRFVRSMLVADSADKPAWADIAARGGYCDQSHLIRDCVALTGASPRDLHLERRRQVIEPAR